MDTNVEELLLIDHSLTNDEHKTIVRSLKTFMNSLVAPIGSSTERLIKSLKAQKETTKNLLSSLNTFSDEIAVTDEELGIIRRALQKFVSLPKPMYESISNIRKHSYYQNTAISLLKEFDEI